MWRTTHVNTLPHCNILRRTLKDILQYAAIHCVSLQETAARHNVLRTAMHCNPQQHTESLLASHCRIVRRTATHCNTLRHTATHCDTLQHTATHYKKRRHNVTTTTHYNTLQHIAAHCHTLQHIATHRNILQHTATNCNTPQRRSTCLL